MAFKVFVSYSTVDLPIVDRLKAMLAAANISVFAAEYSIRPGMELAAPIGAAIVECDLFILLWSMNSRSSEWVGQEIGIAKAQQKAILPVVLDENLTLPGFIKGLKYLSAHTDPEKAFAWLRDHVFQSAEAKDKKQGLVWLGLGAGILWLMSQGGEGGGG